MLGMWTFNGTLASKDLSALAHSSSVCHVENITVFNNYPLKLCMLI